MSLKDQVTEDMKTAMRAKDSARLGTIRLLLAAAKQKEVDERVVLDDAAMISAKIPWRLFCLPSVRIWQTKKAPKSKYWKLTCRSAWVPMM